MLSIKKNKHRKKVCFITSSPTTVNSFLHEPILAMASTYEVYVATNLEEGDLIPSMEDPQKLISIPIHRKISIFKDIVTIFYLVRLFRKNRFDIVHSMTPKAGFLVMISSFIASIRVRIHTFTGQVWLLKKGYFRFLLKQLDIITAFFATHILVDSPSQKEFLITEGIIRDSKTSVLGHGSVSGVNLNRFKPNPLIRNTLRKELGYVEKDIVILYLGRLTKDKGILDLVLAFSQAHRKLPFIKLLMVGSDEEDLLSTIKKQVSKDSLRYFNFTNNPEKYIAASDFLCLPSYREGFGGVVIEAAAASIPAVGSRIYGLTDAIAENESGLLFEAGNVPELTECLIDLAENKDLRLSLGKKGKERVEKYFSNKVLLKAWMKYYNTKL